MLTAFALSIVAIVGYGTPHDLPPLVIHVGAERAALPAEALAVDTLPAAVKLLGEHRARGEAEPARIILHGARYEISASLVIDAALAGEGLSIEAAPDTAPLVSGGRAIAGLRAHDDGTWRSTIEAVRDGEWWFEEVFADLTPRTRARHPNDGFARVVTAGPDNRTSFTFDPAELPAELIDSRSEVVLLHDWSISRILVADVDAGTNTLTVADPLGCKAPHYRITNFEKHPRFFLEGSPRLVDSPGEWALDRATGEFVYFPLPGERIGEARLIAPFASELLRIAGTAEAPVANVTIRGVAFAHVSWPIPARGYAEGQASFHEQRERPDDNGIRVFVPAAISARWAKACRIERCRVSAVGGTGISLGEGCEGCQVSDTSVRETGANGVMVGDIRATHVTVARDNEVHHCLIERCGRRFFGAVGVWIGIAKRTTIARCEVRDLPYTGISIGWRWDASRSECRGNVIEHNHIHDVMRMLSDGGGIYTLGWQPGTFLADNAIHTVKRNAGRAPSNGIFFDQGTKGLIVEGNVIWDVDTTPLRWHMTHSNTVRGNTLPLREGQNIARYNNAKAEDIAYERNRTPNADGWVADEAQKIIAAAGPRKDE